MADAKDVVAFLDKNCKNNCLDCTFELKYIANFVEFKAKSRNTKTFLMSNSSFKAGQRLMEVEVMSELSKIFGVSMQIANTIYKSLVDKKGNNNVNIDDLSALIDQYRIV